MEITKNSKKLSGVWFVLIFLLSMTSLGFAQEKNNEEKGAPISPQERIVLQPMDVDNIDPSLYVPNQIFVKFRDDPDNKIIFNTLPDDKVFEATASLSQIARDYKVEKIRKMFPELARRYKRVDNIYRVTFADAKDISELIQALWKDPRVVYAEVVPVVKTSTTPNDPAYASQPTLQWSLPDINAQAAWNTYEQNPGSPVVVAVVDDAVLLTHEDLANNIWVNPDEIPNNGIDDDNDGYVDDINGYDVSDPGNYDNNPNPPATATNSYFMHGTHVAGIIAGVTDNNLGIASISRNHVKIMAVKTKKEDGYIDLSLNEPWSGIAYAIMAGADIINMSFGSTISFWLWNDLCIVANEAGVILVAAAGNAGILVNSYPASCEHVISVGAVSQNNLVANYSTYNSNVDVMAPGTAIYSTLVTSNSAYGVLDGTSMASPLVAGLCGLILSYNPSLTPPQVEALIENNCTDITSFNPSYYAGNIGAGKINAGAALAALAAGNIPNIPFTDTLISFDNLQGGGAQWGDYDNDGDLDLLVWGYANFSTDITKVYRNDGNGVFTDINAGLIGISWGDAAWGDYDNDGNLDILLLGGNNATKIYHNNGNDTFTIDTGAVLNSGAGGAWGDYDNDGQLDILACNYYQTTLYHNNGNGIFTPFSLYNVTLPAANDGVFGDYDNDGDLDVVLFGGSNFYDPVLTIFRNDGNGVFVDIQAGLQGIHYGKVEWGDYDNDGYLDILCVGGASVPGQGQFTGVSKIYHNNGDGSFTDINAGPLNASAGIWGDYDNDGDLDILLSGNIEIGAFGQGYINGNGEFINMWGFMFPAPLLIYDNNNGIFTQVNTEIYIASGCIPAWGDYDNDGDLDIFSPSYGVSGSHIYKNNSAVANLAPSAPTGLSAAVDTSNNVTLSWNAASDNETPSAGLTYNLVIGTSLNGVNILSPMAEVPTGWRRVAAMGGQNHNTSWVINNLSSGTYYWGVQTVDTAFAGSPFTLGTFVIPGPASIYTLSGTITTSTGQVVLGLSLSAVGGGIGNLVFDGMNYSYEALAGTTVTLTPTAPGYTFSPISCSIQINGNYTQNFVGSPIPINNASISGFIFLDANGNGIQDEYTYAGAGQIVTLTGGPNNINEPFTTDGTSATFNYTFSNLVPGTYTLNFTPATSWIASTPIEISNIVLQSGQANSGNNFGVYQLATIQASVFVDWDQDGVQDNIGEPSTTQCSISLLSGPTSPQTMQAPNLYGSYYAFSNLIPGTYNVEVNVLNGWSITTPHPVSVTVGSEQTQQAIFGVVPATQTIHLNAGWNLISFNVLPTNADAAVVFSSILDSPSPGNLVIVRDQTGMVYWPQYGVNNIGNIVLTQGYQVKVLQACDLVVTGTAPESTTINFPNNGWYIMGYPADDERALIDVLAPLINSGRIEIVKNASSQVYWPQSDGTVVNQIGTMKPGQGYQIKVKNIPSQGTSVTIDY